MKKGIDQFRFKTGDELLAIADEAKLPIKEADRKIMGAYTAIRFVVVRGVPGAHAAWLKVGHQSFEVNYRQNTAAEAAWHCWQLAIALRRMIKEQKGT